VRRQKFRLLRGAVSFVTSSLAASLTASAPVSPVSAQPLKGPVEDALVRPPLASLARIRDRHCHVPCITHGG